MQPIHIAKSEIVHNKTLPLKKGRSISTKPRRGGGGSTALRPVKPSPTVMLTWRPAPLKHSCSSLMSVLCISKTRSRSPSRNNWRASQGEPG